MPESSGNAAERDEFDPFDPFAAVADAEPVPPPSPWESLARHARWLAEMADRMAAVPPAELAPRWEQTGDPDDDVPVLVDPLRDLTEAGQIAQRLTGACRRDVWARLHDGGRGMTYDQIAALWQIKKAAVGNALSRGSKERTPPASEAAGGAGPN
ncbi:MAG TPA: hypothetical protein VGL02_05905 [Streptomyces sp.]